MEALLIFVLFCLAVGIGAFFQSRHFVRDLERRYAMRGAFNAQDVWQAAATAAKGLRWNVGEIDEGIETRHAVGSIIRVEVEPQEDGTCEITVVVSKMSVTSQLAGLINTPRAYRAVQRRRKRILAAVSAVPGANDWRVAESLN